VLVSPRGAAKRLKGLSHEIFTVIFGLNRFI
jgi:hypothetical protein